jgi:tetratricopeptide (TPR) repeat protein
MVEKRVSTRLSGREAVRLGMLLFAGVLVCASCGCAKKRSALSSIRHEYAEGNYEETVALCERALRNNVVDGDVYYYCGLSLLAMGMDLESFSRFERAVAIDGALAVDISEQLVGKARESLAQGKTSGAARRARAAVELNPRLRIGPLEYLVADSFFEDREWEKAALHYAEALAEFPDTGAAEGAYFNVAACQSVTGDSAAAIETLGEQLSKFPRGALASQAEWNLLNLLYDRARSEFERGNYDAAVGLLRRMPSRSENTALAQQARFLLGECYERMGDFAGAYDQYKAIVEEDLGGSGRIAERARAKMDAFRDAGLR